MASSEVLFVGDSVIVAREYADPRIINHPRYKKYLESLRLSKNYVTKTAKKYWEYFHCNYKKIISYFFLYLILLLYGSWLLFFSFNRDYFYHPRFNLPKSWRNRAIAYSNHQNQSLINDNIATTTIFSSNLYNNDDDGKLIEYKLVCYFNFPSKQEKKCLERRTEWIDPFLCTHINIGFAVIVNNTLALDDNQLDVIKNITKLKQINKNLKVLVSVGGAGNDFGFIHMVTNHANRKIFIRSVLNYVKLYKIDGIDLDWEFPNNNQWQRIHFTQLLEEFRKTINKQTEHKFLLTVAVAAPTFIVDLAYDVPYMNHFVDFINLMSYDYHFYTEFTPFTGLNAPLYASTLDKGYFASLNINYSAHYWYGKGMDKNKIIVGLPTYGHSFKLINVANNGLYAPVAGYGNVGSNGFASSYEINKFLKDNKILPIFDMDTKSPYATESYEWISFDNEESLTYKAEFIRNNQFGGAMAYSLNADNSILFCKQNNNRFPLTQAIKKVLDCKTFDRKQAVLS